MDSSTGCRSGEGDIDAVFGPFESLQAAQQKYHELFGNEYKRTSIQKLTDKLPEWLK